MDLKPFFENLYDLSPKVLFLTTVDNLKYKLASIIQNYFGEFHSGSLHLGSEESISPEELSDIISMQESDTTDYLNTIKILGLTSTLNYNTNKIDPNTNQVDFSLQKSLEDFFSKKIPSVFFSFSIVFDPPLYHYEVGVRISYPEKEDSSAIVSFTIKDTMSSKKDTNIMADDNNKKYTGYYACDDGSMDAEVVINKFNLSWNRANVLKYIIRAGKKDPSKETEDLEKARNYINYEIERIKENQGC